jgi:hypothetical protein
MRELHLVVVHMLSEATLPGNDERGVSVPQTGEDGANSRVRHDYVGGSNPVHHLGVGQELDDLSPVRRWGRMAELHNQVHAIEARQALNQARERIVMGAEGYEDQRTLPA